MRVFVLGTGRTGTVTWTRACGHIENYTAGHESRVAMHGVGRLDYPNHHIEADNRLSWHLGELGARFADDPLYIHLVRDETEVAKSYARRWDGRRVGIMDAFGHAILLRQSDYSEAEKLETARYYVSTVKANIRHFLLDKPRQMTIDIAVADQGFDAMWDSIGAIGNRYAAMAEFRRRYNASAAQV